MLSCFLSPDFHFRILLFARDGKGNDTNKHCCAFLLFRKRNYSSSDNSDGIILL